MISTITQAKSHRETPLCVLCDSVVNWIKNKPKVIHESR